MPDKNTKPDTQADVEAALLHLAWQGDEDALERLLRRYRDWLLRAAKAQINSRLIRYFDEEDVVQQAMIEAFRRISELDLAGNSKKRFEGWLNTVLSHAIAALARKYAKRADRLSSQIMDDEPGSIPTGSHIQRRREKRERLERAIAELPDEYRVVIELQLKGLTQGMIAEHLRTTKPAVNARQARARQCLRDALGSSSLNLPSS